MKWDAPSSGSMPTGYILEAGSTSGGSNLFVSRTGGTATSFTTKGAEKGPYFVRVLATNARGTSLPSNEAMITVGGGGDSGPCSSPPSAPGGLRLSVSGTTVTAAWDAAQFAPTSYVVEMSSGPGGNNLVVGDTGSAATTLTTRGLAAGTYVVRVRARNACGAGASSDKAAVVVPVERRE
jgi:predicted phage tail protein